MSFSDVWDIFMYSSSKFSTAFKEMATTEFNNTYPTVNHQPKKYG